MSAPSLADADWTALDAWPGAQLGAALSGGSMNDVRAVTLHGREAVGRMSNRTAEDLDWEIDLLGRLRAGRLGVPTLIPTATGAHRSGQLIVMERIEGDPPTTVEDWLRVNDYLKRLHSLTAGWPMQRPGWLRTEQLTVDTVSGPIDLQQLPTEVLELCRSTWALLPSTETVVIHGDPSPPNIRMTADGVAMIDWDEAHVDNPVLDLAYVPIPANDLSAADLSVANRAFYALGVAMFWTRNPDYAQRRLAKLV